MRSRPFVPPPPHNPPYHSQQSPNIMVTVTLNSRKSSDSLPSSNSKGINTGIHIQGAAAAATPSQGSSRLKLSPDAVTHILDPTTTVECELHLRMPPSLAQTERLVPIKDPGLEDDDTVIAGSAAANNDQDHPHYNLPPIRTPLHLQHKPQIIIAPQQLRLEPPPFSKKLSSKNHHHSPASSSLVQTQGDAAASKTMITASPLSNIPPKIPKPVPLSSRRTKSDNFAQTKSNQRRSIFGQYFDHHYHQQLPHRHPQHLRTQSHGSYPLLSRKNEHQNISAALQRDGRGSSSSSSIKLNSILETASIRPLPVDYRMFAPPKGHLHNSTICGRFYSVEDVNLEGKSLPPLPSPLRRFCSSSEVRNLDASSNSGNHNNDDSGEHNTMSRSPSTSNGGMQGMYPLMTPVSILKPSSYNNRQSVSTTSANPCGRDLGGSDNGHRFNTSFNMTASSRNLTTWNGSKNSFLARKASSSATSASSSVSDDSPSEHNDNIAKTGVRFDPRVTVTEFEDAVERRWYNDCELERLKKETILLAQKYMMAHPVEAERYNRAIMDPVTHTYRKRALFSLPALACEKDDDEKEKGCLCFSSISLSSLPSEALDELSRDQVKRILVVDPNPSILALFRKSMLTMFPSAEIVTAQNVERALKLVEASIKDAHGDEEKEECDALDSLSSHSMTEQESRAFDIIIVEQSLYPQSPHIDSRKTEPATVRPSSNSRKQPSFPWNSSMPDMQNETTFLKVTKPGSFLHHEIVNDRGRSCREPRCGSDLISAIVELMRQAASTAQSSSHPRPGHAGNTTAIASSLEWKALLIGVSMYPDHHTKLMHKAGADIVWGKPIPHVGASLRIELLQALLEKRRNSSKNSML